MYKELCCCKVGEFRCKIAQLKKLLKHHCNPLLAFSYCWEVGLSPDNRLLLKLNKLKHLCTVLSIQSPYVNI
jgi:hypothetical protein